MVLVKQKKKPNKKKPLEKSELISGLQLSPDNCFVLQEHAPVMSINPLSGAVCGWCWAPLAGGCVRAVSIESPQQKLVLTLGLNLNTFYS